VLDQLLTAVMPYISLQALFVFGTVISFVSAGLSPGQLSHDLDVEVITKELVERSIDDSHVYDIAWQILDDALFSVYEIYTKSMRRGVEWVLTLMLSEYDASVGNTDAEVSVSLECLDCWIVGTINETLALTSDDSVQLIFNFTDFQASFNIALEMSGEQTITIPIYASGAVHTVSHPYTPWKDLGRWSRVNHVLSQASHFSFEVNLGLDIVFQVDDQVNLTGGFQVVVPNSANIVADMSLSFNSSLINFDITSDL
jgi:hypothetical protein